MATGLILQLDLRLYVRILLQGFEWFQHFSNNNNNNTSNNTPKTHLWWIDRVQKRQRFDQFDGARPPWSYQLTTIAKDNDSINWRTSNQSFDQLVTFIGDTALINW